MSDEVRHIEISPAQRAGAEKLLKELAGADEKKLAELAAADEGADEQHENVETLDNSDNALAKEVEVKDESSDSEKDAEDSDEKDETASDEKVEKPEPELTEEEKAIREQEKLLEEKPVDRDLTPLVERREWKAARLREKARIQALEQENAKLRAAVPATPLAPPNPEAIEKQIADLNTRWQNGDFPDWDYDRLQQEQMFIRMKARDHQDNWQAQQAAKRATMDATIRKQEVSLPGLRKVFDAVIADPLLGGHVLLGQIVEKNLQNGSGLALLYFLHHHRQTAEEILTSSPDEAAVRLHEIRTRLTKTRKPAPGPTGRPSPRIANSYIPSKSERQESEDGVQKEISKHLHKFAPHRFQK